MWVFAGFAYFMIVTKVQTAQYLKNMSSRSFPVKTTPSILQLIEQGMIKILEDEIKSFPTTEDLDHADKILMT